MTVDAPAAGTTSHDDPAGRIRALVRRAQGPDVPCKAVQAVAEARPEGVGHFLHARFDQVGALGRLGTGVAASPGPASGRIALSAEDPIDADDRGDAVILVRRETTPDDVLGMQSARGLLTARGGLATHAAVVARGWGIPAVVGLEGLVLEDGGITVAGHHLAAGLRQGGRRRSGRGERSGPTLRRTG